MAVATGRPVIEAYGPAGFRIGGVDHAGSVLVLPDRTLAWAVTAISEVTPDSLAAVLGLRGAVELLLLGTGARMKAAPPALRQALRANGIALEPMDTGAACRTYNVLVAEDRRVAAALMRIE